MIKELMNKKIFKFSSITTISSLNICAADWNISNGSITIEDDYCNLQRININNTTYKAPPIKDFDNYNDLCNYLSGLFDFQVNGKKIKDSFGDFNNYILISVNKCDLRTYYLSNFNFNALIDFKQLWNLHVKLIKKPCVRIQYNSLYYHYKNDFNEKISNINKAITNLKFLTIKDFKQKLIGQGIDIAKFNIKYVFYDNEINDNVNFVFYPVKLIYNGDYSDYFEPYKTEIEFIAGDGLELDELLKKNDEIVFVKEEIHTNTPIKTHIFKKYNGLNDSNCVIQYKDKGNYSNYVTCENHFRFFDGQNLKIIINEEIPGFTKKKVDKYNIKINFGVKDQSNYVFKKEITNISNLEIGKGKTYDDLITEINKHLGEKLKSGFVIYKNTEEESNKFTAGPLEDKATYIVVFDKTATDFVKNKDKNKIYISLNFDVTDSNKYKLKACVNNIPNLEFEQNKDYNDLLNEIKKQLGGGKNLKEGFKIYKNDKNNEFTTGAIENNVTYIVVFDNDDTNFVDKIDPKNPPKSQDETEKNNNTKDIKNVNTNNKKGYSSKTNTNSNGKKGCC